jgi:CDP-diacylglycerol pyrophosphatase
LPDYRRRLADKLSRKVAGGWFKPGHGGPLRLDEFDMSGEHRPTLRVRIMLMRRHWLAATAAAWLVAGPARSQAADADVLWRIVHNRCVPHEAQFGVPIPCTVVDRAGGYAVLKDIEGATQFLLIPTARITGIEDPAIQAPNAPNYWRAAWDATNLVQAAADHALPREDLSLAINSLHGRSQNQLHIHIDCIRADVRDALRQHGAEIGEAWAPFPVPLLGHSYQAMRVETLDRPGATPFELLADRLSGARANMGDETLFVVGATFTDSEPGFYLLASRADLAVSNRGEAEELQDHSCVVKGSGQ